MTEPCRDSSPPFENYAEPGRATSLSEARISSRSTQAVPRFPTLMPALKLGGATQVGS